MVYLITQACHSPNEAHKQQLILRDVKPANPFVCTYGEDFDFVKVLDFGLVKQVDAGEESATKLTADGSVPGVPRTCIPRQGLEKDVGELDRLLRELVEKYAAGQLRGCWTYYPLIIHLALAS